MSMKKIVLALAAVAIASVAAAKLPTPILTDEQKAKAEEVKAKAAEAAKKDIELLSKWQDITAQKYAAKLKSEGMAFKPTAEPVAVAAPAAVSAAPAAPAVVSAGPAGAKPAGK